MIYVLPGTLKPDGFTRVGTLRQTITDLKGKNVQITLDSYQKN